MRQTTKKRVLYKMRFFLFAGTYFNLEKILILSYRRLIQMKRIAFIIFLLSCMPFCVSAYDEVYADNDVEHSAGMRVGAYFFHRPIPELELILAEDIRMRDNFTKFDMFLTTAELSYLVNNYFKFGAAYSLLAYFRDGNSYSDYKSYWELRNRIYLHATGSVSAGNFKFALREQLRCTFRGNDYYDDRTAVNPIIDLRTRLRVQYAIRSKPLIPYLSVEMFNPLNRAEQGSRDWISALQYKIGLVWQVDNKNSLEFFYLLDQKLGHNVKINDTANCLTVSPDNDMQHVIAVFYRLRF